MYCESCGSKIPVGSLFCTNCGAKLKVTPKKSDKNENIQAPVEEPIVAENVEPVEAVSTTNEAPAGDEVLLPAELPATVPAEANNPVPVVQEGDPAEKPQEQPKEKKKKTNDGENDGLSIRNKLSPAIIIVASVAFLVLVIVLIFLLSSSARNSIKKAFMSDESYFKSVETNFVEDLVDDLALAYDDDIVSFFDFYKSEYEFNADVTVKDEAEDFLEDIYKQNRDLDLSWIKSANASGSFAIRDKNIRVKGETAVNRKDFIDFDMITNLSEKKTYLGIPILSKEYAAYNFGRYFDADGLLNILNTAESFKKSLPSKSEIKSIIRKYLAIALEKVKRIKVSDEQKLEAAGVKDKYLRITVGLDEATQQDILSAIFKELSKDDDVLAIIHRLEKTGRFGDKLTTESFLDWVEKSEDAIFERNYEFMTLTLWVDGSGKVVAQELVNDNRTGWLYKYVINEENFGFELYSLKNGNMKDGVIASGLIDGTCVTGKMRLYSNGREKLALEFADFDVVDLLQGSPSGKLLFDAYEYTGKNIFRDIKLTVDFRLTAKKSRIDLILSESGKTIVDADISIVRSSASSIKAPSKTFEVENNYNFSEWVNNFEWKTLLRNAEDSDMPTRYYRQLEKIAEGEFASTLQKTIDDLYSMLNRYMRQIGINKLTEEDLINPINEKVTTD